MGAGSREQKAASNTGGQAGRSYAFSANRCGGIHSAMVPVMLSRVLHSPIGVGRHMPRDRHQKGWVHESGKVIKKWKGDYFTYQVGPDGKEKRIHHTVVLGLKAQLKKWESEAKLGVIIAQRTAPGTRPSGDVTLRWFWENRYWPIHNAKLKPSSHYQLEWVVKKHILPRFGDKPISDFDRFEMQMFLNELAASGKGDSLLHKARTYLNAVLDEAMEQKFLMSNPARKLDKPNTKTPWKITLTQLQVTKLLESLQGRDRLIFRLFICCGFRPGELFVLRWNDWEPGQLKIDEAIWQRHIGKPKTESSESCIYIPPQAEKELSAWMLACG